jgi:hypothetical protein
LIGDRRPQHGRVDDERRSTVEVDVREVPHLPATAREPVVPVPIGAQAATVEVGRAVVLHTHLLLVVSKVDPAPFHTPLVEAREEEGRKG